MIKEDSKDLRRRAEEWLAGRERRIECLDRDELEKLAHELAVHQAEIEMQNEELRSARSEAEEARDRYVDLRDFAPVGYFTLDDHNRIIDASLPGCQLLLADRQELKNQHFTEFIKDDETDSFYLHRKKVLENGAKQTLELRMHKADGTPFDALLVSVKSRTGRLRIAAIDITERKRAEESLAESEARYRTLFESAAEGILIADVETRRLQYANPAICTMLGYSQEELTRMGLGDIHPEDSLELVLAEFAAQAIGEKKLSSALPCLKKDGTIAYADINATRTIIDGRECTVGFFADVTERRQRERTHEFALRLLEIANLGKQLNPTLEGFVRAIRDYAGCDAVGIRILDSKGNIPYQAYEGFSREFYESESPLSIKSDRCMCIDVVKGSTDPILPYCTKYGSFYMNGTTGSWATVAEEEKGSTRSACTAHGYESVALVPIRLGDSMLGLIHIADKGTDMAPLELINALEEAAPQIGMSIRRLWTEQELAEEKERLEVTLRSTGDGIIATDMERKVVLLSRAAEKLTGWTQEEAAGRAVREVFNTIDERSRRPISDPVENVIKAGRVIGLVNHAILISRDGAERVIADSGAPIHDEQGRMFGAVLVFHDITELRRLQEEEQKIEKLESIGVLAGGIAHDFNNMLTAILGNVSLAQWHLAEGEEDTAAQRLIEAEKACTRTRDLTQQLLTFARGGSPIKTVISISDLIRDSAVFALRGSSIRCQFDLPGDLLTIEADEGQISQVIHNLVINARDAMAHGGEITISASNFDIGPGSLLPLSKGKYVEVSVADRGIGIPRENLPKVFDPYFTTKPKGSGLGLPTAYSIVKRHGGHIAVESKVGVGTAVCFWLPSSVKPARAKKPKRAETAITGTGRILVMDDEESIRELLGQLLVRAGYEVALAIHGAEAVKLFKAARRSGEAFDAVILDLTVPGGMGGRDTIKKLLEIDPAVRAIVSSGYANDPIISDFKKHGFRAVATKPYNSRELLQSLQHVTRTLDKR